MLCLETDVLQEFGIVVRMKKPLHDRKSLGVHRACVAEFCFVCFTKKKKFIWKEELEKVKDKKTKRSSIYWFSPEMAAKAGLEQTEAWSLELRPAPVANRDPSTGTILHCSPQCISRELDQRAACRTLTDSHIRYHCGQWLNSLCLRASRRALSLWAW